MPADRQPSSHRKKQKYRADGSKVARPGPAVEGPGVWVTCVRGKEKQAVGELYDLFESLSGELWPSQEHQDQNSDSDSENQGHELTIEEQLAKELASIKQPKKQRRIVNCQTNTSCVIFMACRPPVDPLRLVETHIDNVRRTGVTQTRHAMRFLPVSGSCGANLPDIEDLCRKRLADFFDRYPNTTFTYKVELRVRNHSTLSRPSIIDRIAACVPPVHKVDLDNPQMFILVEVFKSTCGISVTQKYYDLLKYNVMEISQRQKLESGVLE